MLTPGDRRDNPDRLAARQGRLDPVAGANVLTVDVDVDERPELSALVEEQVPHGQGPSAPRTSAASTSNSFRPPA